MTIPDHARDQPANHLRGPRMPKPDTIHPPLGFSTRAIHHAYDPYTGHGALNPPLYLSSTDCFPTVAEGTARFAGEQAGFVYSRVGNPTT